MGHRFESCRAHHLFMKQTLIKNIATGITKKCDILNKNDINEHNINSQNIDIKVINGLLTSFASIHKATCIIRGLRAVSDFEYEFQMTGMNYHLNPNIETLFLMASENHSFISSNFVKEVHKLGGKVDKFVSKNVIKNLNKKNK